ncbi:hypothetical protein EJB05_33632, partial [Eragrostis curvula]
MEASSQAGAGGREEDGRCMLEKGEDTVIRRRRLGELRGGSAAATRIRCGFVRRRRGRPRCSTTKHAASRFSAELTPQSRSRSSRRSKTVMTAVLTVMSGLDPHMISGNGWVDLNSGIV